jgi:hypothetical protein
MNQRRPPRWGLVSLALAVGAGAGVALTLALQSGPGRPEGPVLASGVAPVSSGTVVAGVMPDLTKVGQSGRMIEIATATIDASGRFVIRTDPSSRALLRVIAQAIRTNSGWVNIDLNEYGSGGKSAITSVSRRYVNASGQPLSLSELQAAPESGHWISDDDARGLRVDPKYEILMR